MQEASAAAPTPLPLLPPDSLRSDEPSSSGVPELDSLAGLGLPGISDDLLHTAEQAGLPIVLNEIERMGVCCIVLGPELMRL